jgi:hypothetical protein
VKKKSVGKLRGGKGKRRPLRRGALVKKAREVLLEWASLSPETHPINLARLANKLKVSRQALYDNDLDEEIERYKRLQRKTSPTVSQRRNANPKISKS